MEGHSTNQHDETAEISASDVSADCLRVSVILRQILRHFSNSQLLTLSFVNKIWNFEARSLMRDRGTTITHLASPHPWDGLQGFATAVQQMQVVSFSGINIEMRYNHWSRSRQSSDGALDPTHQIILDRFQWKYLSVTLFANWTQHKKCQAFLLAKRILQDFGGGLEEIWLSIDSEKQEFFQEVIQNSSFPRLKILTVLGPSSSDEAFANYMKGYITRAPNLQVLYTWGSRLHLIENIMQGSSAVVVLDGSISSEDFPESAIGILRMKRIQLEIRERNFDLRRFNRITPMALQTSNATLHGLHIDIALVVPLMSLGITLENVKSFLMYINYGRRELTRILRIVKNFDFTRILPKLSQVFIDDHFESRTDLNDLINEIIEQGNASLAIEHLPDRAINIKELYIEDTLRDYAIEFFAHMFPNLQKLTLDDYDKKTGLEISYCLIWEHWTNLKELELEIGGTQRNENLDGVFCGIFPEEVADLRDKDDEYLERVHIVPVMPSLTCLKDLTTLRVIYNYDKNAGGSSFAPLLFSKVTGLIAFKRCPNLVVNLKTYDSEDIEALSHMKPYASVVIDYS